MPNDALHPAPTLLTPPNRPEEDVASRSEKDSSSTGKDIDNVSPTTIPTAGR
jgi:hypothetical protein